MKNIPNKRKKDVTAAFMSLFLSGALLVGGTFVGKIFKKSKAPVNSKPETTMVTPELSELVLSEGFDINDPKAVDKRAKDIYNLSEKEYTVLDIKNMIYLLNEMYDNIAFPKNVKTNDQKYMYFYDVLSLTLGRVLSDYVADYEVSLHQILDDENLTFVGNTGSVPCAYMFMPSDSETKKLAIDIAKIYYEQRTNIRNGKKASMSVTANDYYKLLEKTKKSNLKTGDKLLIFEQFGATKSLFTPFLSEKYAEELDAVSRSMATSMNKLFETAAENLDVPAELFDGTCDEKIEKLTEEYRSKDLQDAKERVTNASIASETSVVNQGGSKVSGSKGKQEVIQGEVTTRVTTSEFVVEIPNEGTYTQYIPGGEVVEENTTKSSAKPSTTTYVDDENIPVMDDKEFFAQASYDDIKDYKKKTSSIGYGLMATGTLGPVLFKKKKRSK